MGTMSEATDWVAQLLVWMIGVCVGWIMAGRGGGGDKEAGDE